LPDPAPRQGPRPGRRLPQNAYRPIGEFRRALREFLAFSEAGAREHGLTSQQHQALLAIKSHPAAGPMTISELADCLLIKTHSAVGLVARLVERDLVERRVSSADRRRVQLILTAQGEEVLEAISVNNLDQLEGVAKILDDLLQTARRLQRDAAAG
jgi:DNA-binding MarR family transcriptional regulator